MSASEDKDDHNDDDNVGENKINKALLSQLQNADDAFGTYSDVPLTKMAPSEFAQTLSKMNTTSSQNIATGREIPSRQSIN